MNLEPEPHQTYSLFGFIVGQTVAGNKENHNKNQARPKSIIIQIETLTVHVTRVTLLAAQVSSFIRTTMITDIKRRSKINNGLGW